MIIQPISPSDGAGFNRLLKMIESETHHMLFDPGERTTTDQEQLAFIERVIKSPGRTILLAKTNDAPVGFIAVMGENLNKKLHSRYISMGVLSKFHQMQIGSGLMKRAIEFCEAQGVARMELTVVTTNLPALNLYRKFGFEIEGTKRRSLNVQGELVDEYFMARISAIPCR
jgi:RimJ/RimL family protein N-acetyltransferase